MLIIAVSGLIGSGKDTIADYLTTFHGFKRMSFAASLKDAVASIFGWDREMLEGRTKQAREWRECVDPWWSERLNMPQLTPRWVLQYWGTDVCRKSFHNDIWIASLEYKLQNSKDNIVISDCRFPNEFKTIKDSGGILVSVQRGILPHWYDIAIQANKGVASAEKWLKEQNIHSSEYSSVGLKYDYTIDNNGTIDALHKQVKSIINL